MDDIGHTSLLLAKAVVVLDEEGTLKLSVDPEFESLLPPLSDEELSQLSDSLVAEGCRDALVVWNGTILDGHNRYRICTEKRIKFRTAVVAGVKDRAGAVAWIEQNQLARRNLTDAQRRIIIGRWYEREKLTPSEARSRKGKVDQNDQPTARQIASKAGVGEATVRRNADLYKKVAANPEIEKKIMRGEIKTKKQIHDALGDRPPKPPATGNGSMGKIGRVLKTKEKAPERVCERAIGQIEIALDVLDEHLEGVAAFSKRLGDCYTRIYRLRHGRRSA